MTLKKRKIQEINEVICEDIDSDIRFDNWLSELPIQKLLYLIFSFDSGLMQEGEEIPGYADVVEYFEEYLAASFDESVHYEVCDSEDPLKDFIHLPPWPYSEDPKKYSGVAYFNKLDQTTGFITIKEILS